MTHNDERFDAWLHDTSADYNAPPPNAQIPREEMWQRIAVARSSLPAPRSRFLASRIWLAAAAGVVLAVGIGIGRLSDGGPQVDSGVTSAPDSPQAYDVATTRHLTSAEAFVTAVRLSANTQGDSVIRRWARDLLTDTRLLLDSPAGNDVPRRTLLEDLELLLVQMVELEGARDDSNRPLLDKTHQDQLLTRLRANVPAGAPPARS